MQNRFKELRELKTRIYRPENQTLLLFPGRNNKKNFFYECF